MQPVKISDFSAGWVPSDDPSKGRTNGLLKMESVELDQNGALVMSGGTQRVSTVLAADVHTIYSKFIGGVKHYFAACVDGKVLVSVNGAPWITITSSGSAFRAAFGALYDSVVIFSGNIRKRFDGASVKDIGRTAPATAPTISLTTGSLTGDYEYIQINVMANGQWIGKSGPSPVSAIVSPIAQGVTVTGVAPTAADADANESWIFRRGGELDKFYRVKRLTSAFTTPFTDNLSDIDAIQLNITLNEFLLTSSVAGIPDPILAVAGPIYGRMIYFTANQIIPSEIGSPDTYDYRAPLGLSGATGTEQFLFAIKGGENVIVVGTTVDLYILTGTFISLPDGFIDLYLRPMSCPLPPIGIEAVRYDDGVIYMSKIGPVLADLNGGTQPLAGLNTDLLYKGYSRQGYAPATLAVGGNYTLAIANNKLFLRVPTTGTTRIEVFDFLRKVWRMLPLSRITRLWSNEDNTMIGYDDQDNFLKLFDYVGVKTLDNHGGPVEQDFVVQTTFHDGGAPFSAKTPYAIKFRGNPGGGTVVAYAKDSVDSFTNLVTLTPSVVGISIIDISGIGDIVNLQIKLSGNTPDFLLEDLEILWEQHPEPTPFLHFDFVDIGLNSPNKKKVAALAFIIQTFGLDVTFTPYIDGVAGTPSVINTAGRLVAFHYFTEPAFGVKYSGTLQAVNGSGFEFYGALTPEVLQVLPTGVKAFQIGPQEFNRYGKIFDLFVRVLGTVGNQDIAFNLMYEDDTQETGTFTVNPKDKTYSVGPFPKTTAGGILRVTLTSESVFHVLDARGKVTVSGKDTDLNWIPLMNK